MKKNKLFSVLLCLIMTFSFISFNFADVSAASFSVRASTSTVAPGKTFKVIVTAQGAGKFSFSASNGSVSTSQAFVDGSYSITVTGGQSGTTKVTVTAIDASGTDESPITGSHSVEVDIKAPSAGSGGGNTSGGSTTPDNRSKENSLESLSISSGTLSPEFSASMTSYKVDLTNDITKFAINAKAKDSKAKVSGTGEKELKIGENNFTITVVAENGAKKTYTISVYVTEKPSVFTKFSDKDYGILTDFSKADLPKGYAPTTVKIDGKDVAALKNESSGLTLLYLQDSDGNTGFYIYENESVVGKLQTITINQKVYIVLNDKNAVKEVNGVKEGTIKIADLEIQGWTFYDKKLSNYSLVYLMNDAGEKGLYTYEGTEGTLQKYVSTTSSTSNTLTYVFIGTTVLFAITTGVAVAMYFNFRKKSISSIKDYYDSKNQGE